jgi:hypothetical protein
MELIFGAGKLNRRVNGVESFQRESRVKEMDFGQLYLKHRQRLLQPGHVSEQRRDPRSRREDWGEFAQQPARLGHFVASRSFSHRGRAWLPFESLGA